MNIDFELDFLYYQEEGILDGVDPKMRELYAHIYKFGKFINTTDISNLLKLICVLYKEKYGQEHYWFDHFLIEGSYKIKTIYPDDLNEETDLYLPKEKMVRKDLTYLILKMFNDVNRNASFMEEMKIAFTKPQDHLALIQNIEEGLDGVFFTREDTSEETVFIVSSSPIASITINTNSFRMIINQEKWIRYFG